MSLARGLTTLNTKKPKAKKLTQKDTESMRRKGMKDLQFKEFEDYVAYTRGQYTPKHTQEKEFKEYAPTQPYVRDTKEYPSLQTSDKIPGFAGKKESQKYTGDLIVGIGTMHKSNAVPIMRGTKQAEELAQMRRN